MDEILFWGLFFSGNKILEDWQKKISQLRDMF